MALQKPPRAEIKRTIKVQLIHSPNVSLSLASYRSNAVRFVTVAWLSVVSDGIRIDKLAPTLLVTKRRGRPDSPVSIDVVVECELLSLENVPLGKDAHSHSFTDDPFGDVAIRITRVIGEPSDITLFGRIDVLYEAEAKRVSRIRKMTPVIRHDWNGPLPAGAS